MARLLAPLLVLTMIVWAGLSREVRHGRADFVFVNRGDVSTLDVQQMSWLQDFRVAGLLLEGLTRHDLASPELAPAPGVAGRWDTSPDGLTYTFHLRPDARWSNGDPVTAEDFIASWRRSLLPENGADYARLFHLIRGGRDFYQRRAGALARFAGDRSVGDRGRAAADLWCRTLEDFSNSVGLSAPDPLTLRVELEHPVPYFLDLTAFAAFYPQHAGSVREAERVDPESGAVRTDPAWCGAGRLLSNGPFVLESWRFKREMRLVRNEHYWDAGSVGPRTIAIPSIADGNAQVVAFRTGVVDWTSDVTPAYRGEMLRQKEAFYAEQGGEVERLRAAGVGPIEIDRRLPADPRSCIHALPSFGTYFYNFNCRPFLADGRANPFADRRVRRAFALTVDKAGITRSVRRAGEPVAGTLIPPGSLGGYESPRGLGFDPPAARALLSEAGYPGGKGLPVIELLFNAEGEHDQIAQAAAKDWALHLGVSVRLVQKEVRSFREDVKKGNFMVSRASWFGDYGDATTFLDIHRTGDGNNDRGYSSDGYDALLARAEREPDAALRRKMLSEAERMLVEDDLPFVPLFHYAQVYLFDAHAIEGISDHPRQVQQLWRVRRIGAKGGVP